MKPWILLPVEIKAREFHAKILQAAVAAERGFDVIIGEQNSLQRGLPYLPRGIIVDKSVDSTKVPIFRRAVGLGNRIAAWCEEGLVYRDRDNYLHERIALDSLAQADRFLAWGGVQRQDVLRKAPDADAKIVATGHPRFDLLRPELRGVYDDEVRTLRERYGDYILIATNFSRYNHFMGPKFWLEVLTRRGKIPDEQKLAFFHRWRDYIGSLYHSFVELVPVLRRAFPDRTIIVRPHPSESHERWRQEVAGLDNVTVAFDGSAIPWIAGAAALVHNSCTTGVEGYLLQRPVIAYRPVTDAVLDSHLPNALSVDARSLDALVAALTATLADGVAPPDTARAEAQRYISAIDGAWAADRAVDTLGAIDVAPSRYHVGIGDRARIAAGRARETAVAWVRDLRIGRGYTGYVQQKHPGAAVEEVRAFVAQLAAVSGRFGGVRVERTAVPGCFWIRSA